jgi:hypothetical protein
MLKPSPVIRRFIRALRKFRGRTWAERLDLITAFSTASVVAGLLHVCSFQRLLHLLDAWAESGRRTGRLPPDEEARILWAVEAATHRILPDRPCLTKALTAYVLLARRGGSSTKLQIGVRRRSDGTLDAHAWLEREGKVIIGGNASPSTYSILTPRVEAEKTSP